MIDERLCRFFYEKFEQKEFFDLIKSGVDINAADDDGFTFLMAACSNGRPDLVSMAIDCGADVRAVDNKGRPAMAYLVYTANDYYSCIELIKKAYNKKRSKNSDS